MQLLIFYLTQIKSAIENPYSCSSQQRTRVVESSLGYVSFFDPATESYTTLTSQKKRNINVYILVASMLALAFFVGLLTPYLIYTSYSKYYTEAEDIDTRAWLENLFWSASFMGLLLVIAILGLDKYQNILLGLLSGKDPNETYLYILSLVIYIVLLLGDILSATIVFYCLGLMLRAHTLTCSSFWLWIAFVVINLLAHLLTFRSVFIIMAFLVSPFEVLLNLIFYCSCILCAISLFIFFLQTYRSKPEPAVDPEACEQTPPSN